MENPSVCFKYVRYELSDLQDNIEIGMNNFKFEFKLSIQNARVSTSDVRLRSFNFKLSHRLINSNHSLNK